MKDYCKNMMERVDKYVASIDLNGGNVIRDSRQMMLLLKEELAQLRDKTLAYTFESEEEEADFFKSKKPYLLSRLIYFNKVYRIETHCPVGRDEIVEEYLNGELDKQKATFDKNIEFYQYYRSGATHRDKYYFVRGNLAVHLDINSFAFESDPKFSTYFDFKVACILASEMLFAYLTKRKNDLGKMAVLEERQQSLYPQRLKWTDKKAAAIELIYAVYAAGSVNEGNVDISELSAAFEVALNIDLGDVYHVFLSMKGRKMSRTVYLDLLKERLLKKMDDSDK